MSKKLEGTVEIKGSNDSLIYTIFTHNMNHEPMMLIKEGGNVLYQENLPSSDTKIIDLRKLNLKESSYYIIVKDSISPRLNEWFCIGNYSAPLK